MADSELNDNEEKKERKKKKKKKKKKRSNSTQEDYDDKSITQEKGEKTRKVSVFKPQKDTNKLVWAEN